MGNRGTTPSWDEEEIAKYGFEMHYSFYNRRFRAADERRRAALVEEHLDDVLELMPNPTEEDQARASFTIPHVINCLAVVDLGKAIENWHEFLAEDVYKDSFRRNGQLRPCPPFKLLSEEERLPFLDLISTIIASLRIKSSRV